MREVLGAERFDLNTAREDRRLSNYRLDEPSNEVFLGFKVSLIYIGNIEARGP